MPYPNDLLPEELQRFAVRTAGRRHHEQTDGQVMEVQHKVRTEGLAPSIPFYILNGFNNGINIPPTTDRF